LEEEGESDKASESQSPSFCSPSFSGGWEGPFEDFLSHITTISFSSRKAYYYQARQRVRTMAQELGKPYPGLLEEVKEWRDDIRFALVTPPPEE